MDDLLEWEQSLEEKDKQDKENKDKSKSEERQIAKSIRDAAMKGN